MLDSTPSQELSPFAKTIEAALHDFGDAAKLGSESPLAAPYLLYQQLEPHEISAEARGKKLRILLRKAVAAIDGKYQLRYQTILQEYYFHGQSEQQVCQLIGKARGIFYKSRKAAIEQLATIVIEQLQPALQREAPPRMNGILTGRRSELHICQQALAAGKTIALTGNSGVGKTTIATHLAAQWQKPHLFWYTVRPGFNDQMSSILFSLGYFFKTLGEPILWQQALAQSTAVTPERMAAIVRRLLQQLRQQKITPLFCFDEIDLLQPAQQAEHGQIIAFLDSLRHETPMILIGQQSTLTVDLFCPLHELTLSEVSQMLENAQIRLKPDEIQLIHTYTTGNPRLIDLLITLSAYGEPMAQLLQGMIKAPPLEYFLSRIVQRLAPMETALLKAISVFPTYAPADLWHNPAMGWAFQRLMERRLLISDGQGGVKLLPAYQEILYNLLSPEERSELHLSAAAIFEDRGRYTAAAHHWIQAAHLEQAVMRWRLHQQQEINQGQAHTAYRLFAALDPNGFSSPIYQTWALLCAELARLIGNPRQALQDLRSTLWSTPVLAINAYIAQGVIANDESRFTDAKALFNQALQAAENLLELRQSACHKGISWANYREVDLEAAWREAQQARYEAENIQGVILEEKGQVNEAVQLYISALALAEEIGYKEGIAKTANNLSRQLAVQGKFTEAKSHHKKAHLHYQLIGKVMAQAVSQINLAFIHNLACDHQQAIAVLQQLPTFAAANHIQFSLFTMAHIHYQTAEAYLGLGDLTQAESNVQQVMALEEENLMPDCWRIMSEISLQRGDESAAEKWILQSIHLLNSYPTSNCYMNGYAQRVLARLYAKTSRLAEATLAKHRAVECFQEIALTYEVEKTVQLLAGF